MFEATRVLPSTYRPAEVVVEESNYATLGSIPKYRWWQPFYLWTQMYDRDPHIPQWNVLDPIMWRIVDLDTSQLPYLQAIYGKSMVFTPPDVASLKE